MPCSIEANGINLDYPVYNVNTRTLQQVLLKATVGGRLMKTERDVTIVRALTNISFKLTEGDRLGLVGHNGSGKSSLLKLLAGVYSPTHGALRIDGRITSMISMSIGLDHEASGLRNIQTMLLMQNLSRKEVARRTPHIIEFAELGPYIHMPFKAYSAGMMARLVFAVGTEIEADVLLMDEWISAGDANFIEKASQRIESFVGTAKLLVLGTHDFALLESVCNKVMVLNAGESLFYGETQDWVRRGRPH